MKDIKPQIQEAPKQDCHSKKSKCIMRKCESYAEKKDKLFFKRTTIN